MRFFGWGASLDVRPFLLQLHSGAHGVARPTSKAYFVSGSELDEVYIPILLNSASRAIWNCCTSAAGGR